MRAYDLIDLGTKFSLGEGRPGVRNQKPSSRGEKVSAMGEEVLEGGKNDRVLYLTGNLYPETVGRALRGEIFESSPEASGKTSPKRSRRGRGGDGKKGRKEAGDFFHL